VAEAGIESNGPSNATFLNAIRLAFAAADRTGHQIVATPRCLARDVRAFALGVVRSLTPAAGATVMTVASSDARTFPPSATRSLTAGGRTFGARFRDLVFIVASPSC
jgi:hypothetical protein